MFSDDVIVVLRTNGERTAHLAETKLREQFADVHVLRIQPFAEAVRQCFMLAMQSGKKWLVTCDGDVLVTNTAASKLEKHAAQLPVDYWQLIGQVQDKLVGAPRLGGLRLYRTTFLAQVLPLVSNDVARPEGHLCTVFKRWMRVGDVFGTHDYDQYYSDLYRKGAQHRVKHPTWEKSIVRRWKTSDDCDLLTALAGWNGDQMPAWREKEPL